MALTFTQIQKIPEIQDRQYPVKQPLKLRLVDITCDNAYSAGGWAVAASDVGLTTLLALFPNNISGGMVFCYNAATGKLMAYKCAGSAAIFVESGGTDSNALVIRCLAVGW
jgi:hypothetical protein